MKNFSFKLLQQLNQKKADKGFTLIELLVVIIIIGILSAIALPAFLNQANKARQSEAKQALGAINRGQQAYYLERQIFSNNIDGLGLGLQTSTENYSYGANNILNGAGDAMEPLTAVRKTVGEDAKTRAGFTGWSSYATTFAVALNQEAVRDYMGIAYLAAGTADQESTTQALLCEEQVIDTGALSYGAGSFTTITVDDNVNCPTYGTNAQNVGQ